MKSEADLESVGHLCLSLDDEQELSIDDGRIVMRAYVRKGKIRVLVVCDRAIRIKRQPRRVTLGNQESE